MQTCKIKPKPLNMAQGLLYSLHPHLSPVLVPLPTNSSNCQQSLQEEERYSMSSDTKV